MKIVANEGVDRHIVEQLRRENHEVIYVAELAPGISDDEVRGQASFLTSAFVAVQSS